MEDDLLANGPQVRKIVLLDPQGREQMVLENPVLLEDGAYRVIFEKSFTLAKAIFHYMDHHRPVTEIDFKTHANHVDVVIGASITIRPTTT